VIEVEDIYAWRGKRVIDPRDEELGKLEDVFFDTGTGTPLLISIKSGLLGRKTRLVPIDEARVGPDHVRVVHEQATFEASPELRGSEPPESDELAEIGQAYGLRFSERVRLESGQAREARRAEAEAARERARQLEAEAQEKIAAHQEARSRAEAAGGEVAQREREAEQARQAALEAREQANRFGES
jgi:sporulation protein YlmC with PRC-barrel domain